MNIDSYIYKHFRAAARTLILITIDLFGFLAHFLYICHRIRSRTVRSLDANAFGSSFLEHNSSNPGIHHEKNISTQQPKTEE